MLADEVDVLIGVDTHRDAHALAVVGAATGGVLGEFDVAAGPGGYRQALRQVAALAPGRRAWALEGTGAYGAGLRRFLVSRGERVLEVERPQRRGAGAAGKSDTLDAVRAARAALGLPALATPRADGLREAIRVLAVARASAVAARVQAIQRLKALIVAAPDELREPLRRLSGQALLARCARLRARGAGADPVPAATVAALRALARRALAATDEAEQLRRDIAGHVRALAPALLAEPGVGPISAAHIILSWSHPGRLRGEACFARLAGVAPLPASSGQVVRHRLDRGGDRQLNRALHLVVLCRMQHHAPTQAYVERRLREGKSRREAMRCLKRYLARHLFRLLEATEALDVT